MSKFLSMIKQEEESQRYGDYILDCIKECKESVPFEIFNKVGAM